MAMFSRMHGKVPILGVAVLTAVVLLGPLASRSAQAAITGCRSDPVVTLSNGVQITLYEDISDTATDVTGITYRLHVPVGVVVTSVSYTGAIPSRMQTITTSADETLGNYDAYTMVNTGTPNIPVTAYMSSHATVSTHTSGQSGQTLHSHLHLS